MARSKEAKTAPEPKEDQPKPEIGDGPSLLAAAAKVEELLAAHPRATDKARFKMFSEWLEDNPEHPGNSRLLRRQSSAFLRRRAVTAP
jgi:hypothetical protein